MRERRNWKHSRQRILTGAQSQCLYGLFVRGEFEGRHSVKRERMRRRWRDGKWREEMASVRIERDSGEGEYLTRLSSVEGGIFLYGHLSWLLYRYYGRRHAQPQYESALLRLFPQLVSLLCSSSLFSMECSLDR